MRAILLFPFILFFTAQQENLKLNGKYRAVSNGYDEDYVIIFNDSVYKKVMSSGEEIQGKIEYYKNSTYLVDYKKIPKIVGQRVISVKSDELVENYLIAVEKTKKIVSTFIYTVITKMVH